MLNYYFRLFKNTSLIFIITTVLLEFSIFIYVNYTDLKIEIPSYTFENTHFFWYDLNEDFGTLHLPNDSYRQKKTCYDITYSSNSQGLRDVDRVFESTQNRVVVLGDSFIEGYGVNVGERLTNLLEERNKKPHLNFGLAGNFGPTQYYVIYNTLVKKYSHDAILVGVLPSNDFIDDDYEVNIKYGGYRYRPFFKGNYPNYELVYNLESISQSQAKPRKVGLKTKLLKNFSYTFAIYSYIKAKNEVAKISKDEILNIDKVPTYFNYSEKQFNRLRYTIEQIKLAAKDKKVMVFTIPIYKEILAYRENNINPLGMALNEVCNNIGVEYLDLLPKTNKLTPKQCEDLFLICDGHWSLNGNLFAQKEIEKAFSYYNN